jgi:uncharacterized cupredoxin-like copper-binding protein
MRTQTIVKLFVILFALFLVACGGQAEPTEVHVTLHEFEVVMDKTSVPAGPVTFIIENTGGLVHELVLEKAGQPDTPFEADGKVSEAEDIEPNTTTTLEWTLDEPGEYQLACHVDKDDVDHYAQGMVKTFTVTEN